MQVIADVNKNLVQKKVYHAHNLDIIQWTIQWETKF